MSQMKAISLVARLLIGVTFLYAGIVHIADPSGFAQAIAAYRILPAWAINPLAVSMPWVEALTGLSLVGGRKTSGASLLASLMLTVFAAALTASLMRGLDISCGCFTTAPEAEKITWWYLLRDIALLTVSIAIFSLDAYLSSSPPESQDPATKLKP
jgi:uncharacterized membrane protein YphA (DoxX/SURF4 family)